MPLLRLRDARSGETRVFESPAIRIGRDPASELPIAGEGADVVSTAHARLVHDAGRWWIEDLSSRNGTYVGSQRVAAGTRHPVTVGDVVGLGERGPRFRVDQVVPTPLLEATVTEMPRPAGAAAAAADAEVADPEATLPLKAPKTAASPPAPPPPVPAAPQALRIVCREARTGESLEAFGGRIRIGRGLECELRPVGPSDTAVSRVHAEIVVKPGGVVVVRDARSRNGTMVNGKRLAAEHRLVLGDRVLLGEGGPELIVEQLVVPGLGRPDATPQLAAAGESEEPPEAQRRSFGGKGATVFFREMMEETDRRTRGRLRGMVWSFVGLLAVATGGVYWWSEQRVLETAAALEAQRRSQQQTADSLRNAAATEYDRLRVELASARSGSAPAAVVDSLRVALRNAQDRTTALEASLQRAEAALTKQLAAGDSLRRQAQADLQRVRGELTRATENQVSSAFLDSLRSALQSAEERVANVDQQVRAVRGVNLAAVAQANQSAVGLVTAFSGGDIWDGSGFVITRSGYFVTNRHVAAPDGKAADSVYVTMADQRFMVRAQIIAVAPPDGPDVAVLRIANYKGTFIAKVDWDGSRARQGEPAALIGFPTGVALALDQTRTVRTSMSAGIFSKVTSELIQFDGFTVQGSSGSPIFNANGEVVAIHRAGLKEAAGLGFAVPVKEVAPLLPPAARSELGIS